jgi:hypothetical protein
MQYALTAAGALLVNRLQAAGKQTAHMQDNEFRNSQQLCSISWPAAETAQGFANISQHLTAHFRAKALVLQEHKLQRYVRPSQDAF